MPTAKMTSKGQITIPVEVRRELGLQTGSRIVFVATGERSYQIRVQRGSVRDLRGCVPAPGTPVSVEQMDEAIAAGATVTVARHA